MNRSQYSSVVVEILERKYTFSVSSEKPPEHITEVAAVVDKKLRQARLNHSSSTAIQTALIAGLDLVDELFNLQERYEKTENDIVSRASRLTSSLEQLLQKIEPERATPVDVRNDNQDKMEEQNRLNSLATGQPANNPS